jgi:hypothetical protein
MFEIIYRWIDVLWLPLVFFFVSKRHRMMLLSFILISMVVMRLQIEIIESTGFNFGFLGLSTLSVHARAMIVYTISYLILFISDLFLPKIEKIGFMSLCLAVFFMAFFTSMLFMCL